jgi:branched-chain amino acid transport system ATP-binding protein
MSAIGTLVGSKTIDDILVVDGLASHYAGGIAGLQDVSLRLARGEILAIVGPNGAGKTTLMRAIANLLPSERGRVTAGRILFEGLEASRTRCDALVRAGLASVLEGRHCFASLTLEENLLTGAAAQGLSRGAARRDLDRIYDLFPSLATRRRLLASQVSGGEQQMTAIGRALMSRPTLLLLDEPSMGLAPLAVRAIFEALARLNREDKLSVLLAEQNHALARRYAHRALGLAAGTSTSADLATREQLDSLYFGRPAAAAQGERRLPSAVAT